MKIEKTVITCDGCGRVVYESGRDIASPYLEIKVDSPSGRRRKSAWTEAWPPGTYWFCGIACLGLYVVDKLVPPLIPIYIPTYPVAAVPKEEG